MAAGDIALKVLITGNATSALMAMTGLSKKALNLKNVVAMAGLAAGAAMIGFGVMSVKAAGDFQAGITTLSTGAGELQSNLAMVSNGILDMAVATGTSTKQLTDGMFMVESAGYRGADALNVLKVAAEGAKVGNADLGVTANAVTTVMKDFGIKSTDAATAMNFLTAIVQNGKTTLQDLAASMSQVLPTASAVHVRLIDVGGAMATMTAEGVPAANAATYLRQMLISLSAPASAGAKSLKAIGLSGDEVSKDMKKSLPATLQLIMTHLAQTYKVGSPQYVEALKNIAGGSKQMQGMLDLTGAHLEEFQQNVKNVSGTMNQGKGSVVGWAQVQQDFNFKMAQASQAVNVLMIRVGTALLPAVSAVVTAFANFVSWLMQGSFGARALEVVLGVVTGALMAFTIGIGVMKAISVAQTLASWVSGFIAMIPTIWGAVTATWAWTVALLANPITWIVIGIVALIAALVLLVTHWSQVVAFLRGVWSVVSSWLIEVWNTIKVVAVAVWTAIANFFVGIWNGIKNVAVTVWNAIAGFFVGVWNHVTGVISGIWNGIKSVATTVWAAISGFFVAIWNRVTSAFSVVWNGIKNVLLGIWNVIKMAAFVIFAVTAAIILAPLIPLIVWFRAHWTQIHAILIAIWNAIKAAAITVWTAIGNFFKTIGTFIHNLITTVWTAISSFLSAAWNAIASVATTIWQSISNFFQMEVKGMQIIIAAVWTAISSFLSMVWNAIAGVATSIWQGISNFFQKEVRGMQIIITAVWSVISSVLSGIWNRIKSVATSIWQGISSTIMNVVHGIQNSLSTAWNNIKSAFSDTMNALGGIAQSAWNAVTGIVKNAINGLIGIINRSIDGVNGITGQVGIPAIPHIPYLASGGTNLPAGMYWVGEAGPELLWIPQGSTVMSHQQSTALMSRTGSYALSSRGGGASTIIVQPAPVMLDKRQVGQILFTHQANEIRRQGGVRNR